ncbi:ankyrin repeat domain-containing protein SOWAHC-like isoform X2 [Hypomesus transpacificus]|uniref:ankyrin repeat domain-containing protein SOWAHC-like isoform X2 n=1 Tax=Hypomesus transpacificus TaxID=137520 RepID=UPI001F073F2D|nr:ankyrin repeat domain-containing protein SOWAHC-like isoform X2 [Hypomesus transpacificus]
MKGGYTALHLASIHGHLHVIQLLINNYNAKTNIRDYHGKMAAHYWSGSTDVFNKPGSQSGGKGSRGRRMQHYVLPSLLLSRSRSQEQIKLEFGTVPLGQPRSPL